MQEQIVQDIANLQKQEEIFIRDMGMADNDNTRNALMQEIENVRNKIAGKQQELTEFKQQRADTIAAEVVGENSQFQIAAGGFVADFRSLAAGEEEYQVLSITTQIFIAELEADHTSEVKAIKDSYESEIEASEIRYASIEAELAQTRADLQDARARLENAVNQLSDAEAEADNARKEASELRKNVEELRKQFATQTGPTNINGTAALHEAYRKLEEKKPKIYNVRPGDNKTSFYIANLLETDAEINIPWMKLSAYRQVTDDEVSQFRKDRADKETEEEVAAGDTNHLALVAPPLDSFRGEPEEQSNSAGAHGDDVGMGTETFEDEVRRRLKALEDYAGI